MIRLALLLICLAGSAAARDLPALHHVTGVAGDDMLNIRTAPDAGSDVIGTLAPDQRDVEVIRHSDDGKWGLVNIAEQSGWAALLYLTRQDGPPLMERPLSCFGTEPFWSLTADRMMNYTMLDEPPAEYTITTRTASVGRSDRYALGGGGMAGLATAVVAARICSDGMSDRSYGLDIDLLIDTGEGQTYLSGCCSLQP